MIKCISYWSLPASVTSKPTIDDTLALVKAEGFAGLELSISTEGLINVKSTKAQCEAIRKKIDKSGLIVETVGVGMTWGVNPVSNDPAVRKRSVELHAAALQRTAWLGCKAMLFVPGVVKSPISTDVVRYDLAVQRSGEAVRKLLETAEKVGVDLCVENVWNGMFYSPVEFASFVDSIKSPNLGIYFDVGNVLGYHQNPPDWIEILGKRIKRVHIKDFKCSIGSLAGFCDLMAGDVPWAESMAALRKIGYDKTVIAEMMPYDAGLLSRTSVAFDKILAM